MSERIVIGVRSDAWPSRLAATLAGIARNTTVPHQVVELSDRNGAACLNRLLTTTDADIVVLLESGALVAPRWLDHLLVALRQPRAGLAGPSTNHAWNEQRAFPAASEEELTRIAVEAERRFGPARRTLAPLYSLGDFCYAVKRQVYQAIGPADEGYESGPCWELDYNIRAARAGFEGLWACAAFVWRAPVGSQRAADERAAFDASRRRYQDKFCGARLRGEKKEYSAHCRGDECSNFAPRTLSPGADPPLVSCIMPTCDRRRFVPGAVRAFLAQDYPNLELIVVDDGMDPIRDLLPPGDRFVYVRVQPRKNVGAKRNIACERARGEVIAHWDDDDWYPADRIRTQVKALLEKGADICGTAALHFIDRGRDRAWIYRYPAGLRPWVAGNTLMYRRAFWRNNPFPDLQVGEDAQFIWRDPRAKVLDLDAPDLCVATVHAGNVSPKDTTGECWTQVDVARVREAIARGSPMPLVSCVMATYNRRPFIPLALETFRAQTHERRELIVVDDGADAIGDLCTGVPGVRYVRLRGRATIGAKRNAGAAAATGEILVLWDDDDWYAPSRIERQIAPIVAGDAELTGLTGKFVLELPQRRWWAIDASLHRSMFEGNVVGGTIAFHRRVWTDGVRFPEISLGEDAGFLREAARRGLRLRRIEDDDLFLYVRHCANTWQFHAGAFLDAGGWRQSPALAAFSDESLEAYAAAAAAHARQG
ncbi:MAG TPA: glycosyltransferase [Thermoanaerobaculia bacterium]|nr:glycosyltransferase [Thermoanaerobaculia bacterium]